MRTVWKFGPFLPSVARHVEMPVGARIVLVDSIDYDVWCWAEVETTNRREVRDFIAIPTGSEPPSDGAYIGTALVGAFVWHLFCRTSAAPLPENPR